MKIKTIIWDFDGVILASHPIREMGFKIALQQYPKKEVEALLAYHRENGGWSRYVKFAYFFEKIRKKPYSEEDILNLASAYSNAVKSLLINKNLLIEESISFILNKGKKYRMYIASGSAGKELNEVCQGLGISEYFHSIHGSPEKKSAILNRILKEHQHDPSSCLMIGDAKNDYDAAVENNIPFLGFNNPEIEQLTNIDFTLSDL